MNKKKRSFIILTFYKLIKKLEIIELLKLKNIFELQNTETESDNFTIFLGIMQLFQYIQTFFF